MNALLKFEQDLEWYVAEYNTMKLFKASTFIVKIRCSRKSYDHRVDDFVPSMVEVRNEILIYDEWTGKYTWLTRWWDGEEYLELLGLIDINGVNVKTLKEIDEMEYGKDD